MTPLTSRRDLSDAALTEAVLGSFAAAPNPRFRQIAQSLVRHLHAFVHDAQITEEEWFAGIEFLTRAGHITDERRQEFVLLSDVLGLSMLVIGLNHRKPAGATESTVFGPFYVEGSPAFSNGDDLAAGAPGQPCLMRGRILSVDGAAVPDARIEVWQADEDGLYDVQIPDLEHAQGRGHLHPEADGRFWFWSVLPEAYPIPGDGPVGDLLKAGGRRPMRPAHVHFMVTAPGYEALVTHVFVADDEHLDSDAVFGVKSSLVCPFERREPGTAPDGRQMDRPYFLMDYDLVLAPAGGREQGDTA